MKYFYLLLIFCVTELKGNVVRADEDLSCKTVETNLAKINDSLRVIKECLEDLGDPKVPPTSTMEFLNTELNKYKIPLLAHKNCESAENKATIDGFSSKKLALSLKFNSTYTQYTNISTELNNNYTKECKDPTSQSSKALADNATYVSSTIRKIRQEYTQDFDKMVELVEKIPSDIFACLLASKLSSILTDIKDFKASMIAKIETQQDVLTEILTQNLTLLEYAIQKIDRWGQNHKNLYFETCKSKPKVDSAVYVFMNDMHDSMFEISINLNKRMDNMLQEFQKLVANITACNKPSCIDSRMDFMQGMQTSILNDTDAYTTNVTSLITSTSTAVVRDFDKKIEQYFECYLNVLSSGTSVQISILCFILLVLVNLTVI